MAFAERLYDFTPSTLIQSSQVDAEFDQLISLMNHTPSALQVKFSHNAGTDGFVVNATGGGNIVMFQVSSAVKASIAPDGKFRSYLTTGTAPFQVASTTMVDNLNVASVQGVSDPVSKSVGTQEIDGGGENTRLQLTGTTSSSFELDDSGEAGLSEFRIKNTAGEVKFQVYDDASAWLDIMRFDLSAQTINDGDLEELASQTYVDGKRLPWSFGVFYAGGVDTSVVQAVWIIPNDEDDIEIERVRWLFQNGTPTGSTTIKLWHYNSAGVEQNSQSFSLLIGDSANQSYDADVNPDWDMASGDFLKWTVTLDGGHQDISIHAQGTQSVI